MVRRRWVQILILLGALLLGVGSYLSYFGLYQAEPGGPTGVENPNADAPTGPPPRKGPHGGRVWKLDLDWMVELARKPADDRLTLWILGPDGAAPAPIFADEAPVLTIEGEPPVSIPFEPRPTDGDFEGMASRFEARTVPDGPLQGVLKIRAGDVPHELEVRLP